MAQDLTPPDPGIVLDLLQAFRRSKAMFAAVSLGVFEALAAGPKSPTDLAHDLRADPDALERLLDACVGLQLIRKQGDRYENAPVATAYLTQDQPPPAHRLHHLLERRVLEAVGQPRRRRAGGHPPLGADLRPGGGHLRPLLPHRGGEAGVPDGHARPGAHQLAARRRGLRPEPLPPPGRPGRGDGPPGDGGVPALGRVAGRGLRPARGPAAGPRGRRGVPGGRPDRVRGGGLLRRPAARGRPVRPGPHPARLGREEDPATAGPHPSPPAARAGPC